jgi:hypothetical protein
LGVQNAIDVLDCFDSDAETMAGKIPTDLIIDVGSLEVKGEPQV